jgi:hypothetical protein
MQHVITADEARKITKGRTPLVPVEYETACKSLESCMSLDESKYWSDKADALAAWAKIYHDEKVGRQARALKLHAYRRMGQLAAEIAPKGRLRGRRGSRPGPLHALIEAGLTKHQGQAARRLGEAATHTFETILDRAYPPSPQTAAKFLPALKKGPRNVGNAIPYSQILGWSALWQRVISLNAATAANNPEDFGRSVRPEIAEKIRSVVRNVQEWLDEFERHLPKAPRT